MFHQSCGYTGDFEVHGVLSVEHTGKPCGTCDGVCLSLLVAAASGGSERDGESGLQPGSLGKWVAVEEEECVTRLRRALEREHGCTELFDLHADYD